MRTTCEFIERNRTKVTWEKNMNEIGWVVLLLVIAWVAYLVISGYKDANSNDSVRVRFKAYSSRDDAMGDTHAVSSGRGFNQEVVGESHYQAELTLIMSKLPAGWEYVQATLIMEDNNPHDKNAVAVKIGDLLVGYLPKAAAKEYRQIAKEENIPASATCPAVIKGGGSKHYGVWLGLPELT